LPFCEKVTPVLASERVQRLDRLAFGSEHGRRDGLGHELPTEDDGVPGLDQRRAVAIVPERLECQRVDNGRRADRHGVIDPKFRRSRRHA
jgi:hypothetical protein